MVNRRDLLKATLAASALTVLGTGVASAQMFETRAGQAFMVDAETGTILFSKDADKLVPPASLAKLMTMEVVFHNLKTGQNTLDDTFHVSENAWRTGGTNSGGSTMFAKLNSQIRLEDLIQGVVIQSANDGCIVIAEGMAGSEVNFATLMNERARAIGLEKSVFKNSTGLPAEGQLVTMRELAQLAMHIWREYPDRYGYYSQRDFTWNKIKQRNRNPLLAMDIGADGMKTGFTEESGYAIVGSVNRDGKRLFVSYGCSGCHNVGNFGGGGTVRAPTLAGVYGHPVPLTDGGVVVADDQYIRDSILQPGRQIVASYENQMPSFAGIVSEEDLIRLVAYVKSLAGGDGT